MNLGKKIVPEVKTGPVIKRLGPKLWSVDGKYQDFDPTPPPPVDPYQHMLELIRKQQEAFEKQAADGYPLEFWATW